MRNLLKVFMDRDAMFYVATYAISGTLLAIGLSAVVILVLLGLTKAMGV